MIDTQQQRGLEIDQRLWTRSEIPCQLNVRPDMVAACLNTEVGVGRGPHHSYNQRLIPLRAVRKGSILFAVGYLLIIFDRNADWIDLKFPRPQQYSVCLLCPLVAWGQHCRRNT